MSPPRQLPGGIPIPALVIGLPLAALAAITLATRLFAPDAASPRATPLRAADLILHDHDDGSITVSDAADQHVIDTVPPATNAFLRVMLAGLVRERRRESLGAPSLPFHLTRWSDGRLTIDDIATHKLIELNAFGPDNAAAFARLLDLDAPPISPLPPARPPTQPPGHAPEGTPAVPATPPPPHG